MDTAQIGGLAVDQKGQSSFCLLRWLFQHFECRDGAVDGSRVRLAVGAKTVPPVEVAATVDVFRHFLNVHPSEIIEGVAYGDG